MNLLHPRSVGLTLVPIWRDSNGSSGPESGVEIRLRRLIGELRYLWTGEPQSKTMDHGSSDSTMTLRTVEVKHDKSP